MSELRKTVFISYAREDRRHAERLYADLREASVDAWLDSRSLQPGQDWKREIRRAIRSAAYVIVLLSEHSVTKRGFVQTELKESIEESRQVPTGDVFIVPARLSDVHPGDDELLNLNWVDLFPSYEKGLERILAVLAGVRNAPLEYSGSMRRAPVAYAHYRSFDEYLEDFIDKMPKSASVADPDYAVWITCRTSETGIELPEAVRKAHPVDVRLVLQNQFEGLRVKDKAISVVLWFGGEPNRVIVPLSAVREVSVPSAGIRLVRL